MIFLDTSALVKAYVEEPGSEAVREVIRRLAGRLFLSDHVALETLATFAYKHRDRRISRSIYRKARAEFFADYTKTFEVTAVTGSVVQTAMRLAHDHRMLGVGSIDLIHVATAIHLRVAETPDSFTVVCADRSMRLLAVAAGLAVFDPEQDDPARLGRRPAENN